MELILIRHPRPAAAEGICYGRSDLAVPDQDLDSVYAALSASNLPGDAPVFSSPLRRCADLARRLSPTPVFDANLAEMDFGTWELRGWADIPRTEVDAWAADLPGYRPGGGETVRDVARRVAAALDAIGTCGAPRAVVVCHAGTIRLATTLARGMLPDEAALAAAATPHRIGYGEVVRVMMDARMDAQRA